MTCLHKQLEASLDRWQEMHWQIHQIENHYHEPDGVRFSFNSFIRAAKEMPQIIHMELNRLHNYKSCIKPILNELKADTLFSFLSGKRNFLVHQGMLDVLSSGFIGTTEGKGWKISFRFDVHTSESSDDAYLRFKHACRNNKELRSLMGPDCDSWPMLERSWFLPDFPEQDFLDVAVTSWKNSGNALSKILTLLGGAPLNTQLNCIHNSDLVRRREYSQDDFFRYADGIDVVTGKPV